MSETFREFDDVETSAGSAIKIIVPLLLLAAIGTVAAVAMKYENMSPGLIIILSLLAVAQLVVVIWLGVVTKLVRMMISAKGNLEDIAARLERVESLLENQSESSKKLIELAAMPDQVKSLIFRDREVEAFRENFNANLASRNYEAAMANVETMEKKFGRVDEAQKMRAEIDASKKATQEERIDKAVAKVKEIIEQREFQRAAREIEHLQKVFNNNPKVLALQKTIESEKTNQKRELLQEYGEAVRKNDIDRSIELLKQLDRFLTPQEASALQESARGVFKAKLHNLGVQFSIAITEGRWDEAKRAGEEIIREFPNTKMSQEVRAKIAQLEAKISGTQQSKS